MYAFVIDDEEFGNPKQGGEAEYDSPYIRLSEVDAVCPFGEDDN